MPRIKNIQTLPLNMFFSQIMQSNLTRFILVGISGFLSDAALYSFLMYIGLPVVLSKGISYIFCATYGYFLNAMWSFKSKPGLASIRKYCLTYMIALVINVSVNQIGLLTLSGYDFRFVVAFLASVAVSTTFSYSCLRFWVFK